ncbi:hypothetical protein A3C87_00445 [Candidatus Kaiserbacteria bacterium RIFCSPHIGHO2_02_FULL_49_34]|uniref:Uncharacterized protein n=1 Tax=Candidatus Kaiserbacteria bacterium RIFCSPHIGHO2_02_FULL_49_34 TaxID=1798491 RepID=A0A1F6DKC2_9BACT|nr:MAG: hypothetical protein A3C87_00445 [Candidatus Kaiserbacteria bacterium RIFCSPHIGHO2_02_FULL_49_34]
MDIKILDAIAVTPAEKSQVTIVGELPWELAEKQRAAAVAHLGKGIKLDGFRPGNIPEAALVKQIGEGALLQEMAFRTIIKAYEEILKAKGIDALGGPALTLTKLAVGNPVGFSIVQSVVPTFELPDYKGIAAGINKTKETVEVSDEDVQKQIDDILHRKTAWEKMQKLQAAEQEGNTDEAKAIADAEPVKIELTEETVKELGAPGQFSSVEEFKAKIREHLEIEKKNEVASKHKAAITDAIVEATTLELPDILIDTEIKQMFAQMEDDLTRANLKMDDYLSHVKKTRDDMRAEWLPMAQKRAKLQLILEAIAKKDDIKPTPEALEVEVQGLLARFKDADETRVRAYVTSFLTNDAVMNMLEKA